MNISEYQQILRNIKDWDFYLLENSGLPGPRGNIELGKAVAEEGNEDLFLSYLKYDSITAPTNSPQEFLAFCGVLGLGRLLSQGRLELLDELKKWASDERWRIRKVWSDSAKKI